MNKKLWIVIGFVVLVIVVIAFIYKKNKPLLDKSAATPRDRSIRDRSIEPAVSTPVSNQTSGPGTTIND